jgi:KaiC/GvpD/RAD55 family RecA-like ATPase
VIADLAQIPPHDLDAEACVLGSILLEPSTLPAVRGIIEADDFFRPSHAQIFNAAAYVAEHPEKWGPLDLVIFKAALESRGSLCKIIGKPTAAECMAYLDQLCQVPSTASVEHYARAVRDKSRLRKFIAAASALTEEAWGSHVEVDEFMVRAAHQLGDVMRVPTKRSDTPGGDVLSDIQDVIDGRRRSVSWPFPALTRLAKPAAPGCVTVLCGDPGSNKSFFVLQSVLYWTAHGVPVALLPLEKDRKYHLMRALAQMHGDSNLTNDDWKAEHPNETIEAWNIHQGELDAVGARIWEADGMVSLGWVMQWIRARAQAGDRIIVVDPITAADPGQRPWEADREFVVNCQSLAAIHGCTIVLVTHPRMSKGQKPTLETMAGGLAYARFPDVVLWLAHHDPPEQGTINTPLGPIEGEYTHHIAMFKTRDSSGRGMRIACSFDKASLIMQEHGWIQKRKGKGQSPPAEQAGQAIDGPESEGQA